MFRRLLHIAFAAVAAVAASPAFAEIKMGAPFTDGAVLQRGMKVPVWGWATPSAGGSRSSATAKVTVEFAGQKKVADVGADGSWKVELDPMEASKESRAMTVSELQFGPSGNPAAGKVEVKDVLVGEVWFASGQSNMECPIWGSGTRYRDMKGGLMTTMTRLPFVRYVKPARNWSVKPVELSAKWCTFTPENLQLFYRDASFPDNPGKGVPLSAVAFYYARELYLALDVPIGIVNSSWGGTNIDAWTPRSGYDGCDESIKATAEYEVKAKWKAETDRMEPITSAHQQPTVLYNGMVAAFAPMAMRGLIWYQGCHNYRESNLYCAKLHALYEGWRRDFANDALKMYLVQLAPYNDNWLGMCAAQNKFVAEERNAAIAVVSDAGNFVDIHPNDKEIVAKRLVVHALKRDYGFPIPEDDSPVFRSVAFGDGKATLSFDHVKDWYVYSPDRKREPAFELAGADGKWLPAKVLNYRKAKEKDGKLVDTDFIDGPVIELSSEGLAEPVKVRYMGRPRTSGTLYNEASLPLGPFESMDSVNPSETKAPPQQRRWESYFTNWPDNAKPSLVSQKIARQFLTTSPDDYKPEKGYRGNDGYGSGKCIAHPVASLWVSAMECARIAGDKGLEQSLVEEFEPYLGVKSDVLPNGGSASVVGIVPLEVAILKGDRRARELGLKYADGQLAALMPDDLLAQDGGIYMAAALQTQAYRLTSDRKYIDRAAKEIVLCLDRLQQPNGLLHHWMAGAMAMVLRYLPAESEFRPRIMDEYTKMMATLLGLQREDGMWDRPVKGSDPWKESFATAMFAYAFAEGVRGGWLDAAAYGPAMRKAYLALASHMDKWGNVASIGDPHGQAAMLWLCRVILETAKNYTVKAAQTELDLARLDEPLDGANRRYELLNRKADGFRGIWYFNQKSKDEYVYKYSGGLGTYCAGHIPMAVYSKEADKTFFTYGGTDVRNTTLLQCVSYFDHKTGKLARPTVVFDKHTFDAHDNAVINMDDKGYIYIFSSSHGTWRPSAIARSEKPYDISSFKVVWDGNFSYPQPFWFPGKGFLFLHAWYVTGRTSWMERTNCMMTSDEDGTGWSDRTRLVYFNEGHYQRAWQFGTEKVGIAFDQHPKGKGLNWRTDVFYMESDDFGATWKNAAGDPVKLPVDSRDNPALALSYADKSRNVYIKGVKFDGEGRPIVIYTVSKGYRSGPEDGPREWKLAKWTGKEWREIDTGIRSDSNYDFAELYVEPAFWRIIGASESGPQPFNPGGEIAAWISRDAGETWSLEKKLTSGSERNQNYPRQPLNVHPGFYAFWADGHGRKPSVSRLYFCDKDLNVYMMPLSFEGDAADPIPYKSK